MNKEKIQKEFLKYFKMNLKSFIILFYLKTLRLYSLNSLSLSNYDKAWFISLGGSLLSLTLNNLFGPLLTKQILKIYDENETKAREIASIALSIFYVLFIKYLYMRLFFGKDILNKKYFQITIISILSITFYSGAIKPLFNDSIKSKFFNSIINDTILLLSSDFVSDASLDTNLFDIEINTIGTFFRLIINSIITI